MPGKDPSIIGDTSKHKEPADRPQVWGNSLIGQGLIYRIGNQPQVDHAPDRKDIARWSKTHRKPIRNFAGCSTIDRSHVGEIVDHQRTDQRNDDDYLAQSIAANAVAVFCIFGGSI